jgi:hypothetical protein
LLDARKEKKRRARRTALSASNVFAATPRMSQRPADEFNESEVLPGVYLTDFRPPKNTSATPETLAVLGNPRNNIEVLKLDIQEIENSLFHLRRSNKELAEAAETDDDPGLVVSLPIHDLCSCWPHQGNISKNCIN